MPQDTLDLLETERGEPVEVPRGARLDWAPLRAKIAAQGMRNSNVLAIAPTATIANVTGTSPCIEPMYKNLFLPEPDMKAMSHMYRRAWRVGLKTTYYLRTLGASSIEKATVAAVAAAPGGRRRGARDPRADGGATHVLDRGAATGRSARPASDRTLHAGRASG